MSCPSLPWEKVLSGWFCVMKKGCAVLEKDHITCAHPGQHTSISTNQTGSLGRPAGKALVLADALLHLTRKPPDWENCCCMYSSPVEILMVELSVPCPPPPPPHGKWGKQALSFLLCSSKCSTRSSCYAKDGRTAWSGV